LQDFTYLAFAMTSQRSRIFEYSVSIFEWARHTVCWLWYWPHHR